MNEKVFQGYTEKKLYELLPAVYRQRDSELGYPLKDLIAILAKQVAILEKDIGGLYENWFIETCDEWVTAYLADLVGAKSLSASRISSLSTTAEVTQRAFVANTIGYRRRKGTLSMLEQLARDTTQWGARGVEFFKLLAITQNINHIRNTNHRTPDLRNTNALELLDTPFDTIAHTVEVRRIASNRGRYNIPNVGLFLWRLMAFPSYDTLAFGHFEPSSTTTTKFSFNPFGYDIPLFNKPDEESSISSIAGEVNLPVPIRRRAMYDEPSKFYDRERSIMVEAKHEGESSFLEIPLKEIQICKMGKDMLGADIWAKPAPDKTAAIDPETGRISLSAPAQEVRVTYYYGFSSKIGGGMYKRERFENDSESTVYKISKRSEPKSSSNTIYTSIKAALDAWNSSSSGDGNDNNNYRKNVIFDIADSEEYGESLSLDLPVGCTVAIVASNEKRPILSSLTVKGERGSSLVLDGLWFKNPSEMPIITIDAGDIRSILIRHCTLVTWKNIDQLKVAIGMKSSIRRRLCLWEDVPTSIRESQSLLKFLKKNFANWIIDDDTAADKMNVTIKKSDGNDTEIMTITTKDNATKNAIELVIENANAIESVCRMSITKDGETKDNVYQFIVMRENGKKNLYLKGGNDDLELSLDRSISGRVQILNSFVFSWEKISEDENERRNLISFLKANFSLPWWTENWERLDNYFDGAVLIAKSDDPKHSLTITAEENRAVLRLTDKEIDDINISSVYEFALSGKKVYFQSDAHLSTTDSIIDGKGSLEAIEARSASLQNTTVFGSTRVGKLKLASNSIFTDSVQSMITQEGCVRFSYVPKESVTPRRYMCKPDETAQGIEPKFTSEKYGDPGYAQLDRTIAPDIFAGADNKAEMGVFNHLLEPQRLTDLRISLNEYLRFGLEVGIFLVT